MALNKVNQNLKFTKMKVTPTSHVLFAVDIDTFEIQIILFHYLTFTD